MAGVGGFKHEICVPDSPPDLVIAMLAAKQHGAVAHWQLIHLGLTPRQVHHRIGNGHLRRMYRGVYAVGHARLTREGHWMAAVLACGDDALLSHRDGAALWGIRRAGSRRAIDVTAARSRSGHAGIALHRPRNLHPEDRAGVDGIPVTSLARTLLDLAEVATALQLDRAVEQAELRGVFDLRAVEALLARSNGRRGAGRLERAIAGARPVIPFTRSDWEDLLTRICRDARLPQPAMNLWVEGYEADALFAQHKVIVEIDGGGVHGTRQARRRDPIRDATLQIAGYLVLRVSDEWMTRDPAGVAQTVRRALEAAPGRRWAA